VTSTEGRRTPQRGVRLDADFGCISVLLSNPPVEHLLSDALRRDLASWLAELERSNPSDPDALGDGWVEQALTLRGRVQAELGPGYEVVWEADERRAPGE